MNYGCIFYDADGKVRVVNEGGCKFCCMLGGGGVGVEGWGSGVTESIDGWECAILALELVPQNLIFAEKSYPKIYFTRFYAFHFSKESWRYETPVLYLMNDL